MPAPHFSSAATTRLGSFERRVQKHQSMCHSPPNTNTKTKTKRPSLCSPSHAFILSLPTCFYSCTFSSLGPLTHSCTLLSEHKFKCVGTPLLGATTGPMSSLESSWWLTLTFSTVYIFLLLIYRSYVRMRDINAVSGRHGACAVAHPRKYLLLLLLLVHNYSLYPVDTKDSWIA